MASKRSYLYLFLVVILALALQETWAANLRIAGVSPKLTLFCVVFVAFYLPPLRSVLIAFCIGLLEDLLLGKYIGLNTLSLVAVAFLVALWGQKFYKDNYLMPVAAVFCGSLIYGALFLFLSLFTTLTLPFWYSMVRFVIPQALYNAVLAPLFYLPLYHMYFAKDKKREQEERAYL